MTKYVLTAALWLAIGSVGIAHADGVSSLKDFFLNTQSMRADFKQEVVDKQGRKVQKVEGTMQLQRPNKFRWDYQKPYEQQIISDGKQVFLYDVDLQQVTVRDLSKTLGSSPAAMLAGGEAVEKSFTLKNAVRKDDLTWVLALPKDKESGFDRVLLGFKEGQLKKMELYDSFSHVTHIAFNQIERNPALTTQTFLFTTPKGWMWWANSPAMQRLHAIWLIGCVLAFTKPAHAMAQEAIANPSVKHAEVLMQSGDYESAYQTLLPLEQQYAGNLDFDVLLGSVAVESGHYTQGMFALERVLAIEPNHQVARAKIAKAHFFLGEVAASKIEFSYLLNQNPSAEAARAIEKYLSAIDKAMGLSTTYHGFLEAGLGWDSNVNSATGANTISVPVFGGLNFELADEAKKKSDSFFSAAGGAGFRIPATENLAYVGNVQFAKRVNQTYHDFETAAIDLNLGVQMKYDDDTYTFALQDGHFYVDDARFRHAYGATAQWQKNIDQVNQASIYGQYAKLEYDDSPIRDANRYLLGVNYAHAFEASTNPVVFLGAYVAKEDTVRANVRFLDQDIYGVRAGGQLTVAPSWLAYVSAGYESRDYQAEDLAFLRKRKDDQYDITLGVNYVPARYWTVKPQISLIKNDSNIELNGFERATMSINIRRDFNW